MKTRLDTYDKNDHRPGASRVKIILWAVVNAIFLKSGWNLSSGFKIALLRLFGARIGHGVVIKPSVSVKYPWRLVIGDHAWIGEHAWIDNLADVKIGSHVCISQGAMLLTGNHDYSTSSFSLKVGPIVLEDGVWIGARATVCPGVTARSHAVLAVGSVATRDLDAYMIYQGNPALPKRARVIAAATDASSASTE